MEVRPASAEDVPAVVDLLKKSLGEGLMPKSEAFWRWKHLENPFGLSPVLLAVEGGDIVGVRAFMRWEWRWRETTWMAVRAVDTATHPAYQGRGIFRKLTLALVDQCKQAGTHFIFNTPNSQSRPGYLKMGWRDAGRMRLTICPRIPVADASNSAEEAFDPELYLNDPRLEGVLEDDTRRHAREMVTNRSASYLKWRYLFNPNIRYVVSGRFSSSSSFLFICRVKSGRYGVELRVCDSFRGGDTSKADMSDSLIRLIRHVKASLVTFAAVGDASPLFGVSLSVGPRITLLDLNGDLRPQSAYRHWRPSLGDMEVF